MIDINKLYSIYIDENTKIDKEKAFVLEKFRTVESNYKYYEDALNILEKEKNKAKIDSYERLSNEIIERLSNFNPTDIQINLPPIEKEINYLIEVRDDVSNTSQKFKHTVSMWNAFLERNKNLDLSSLFIRNITEDIKKITDEFIDIDLNNLSRIEENIIDLNHSITRSITMMEDLDGLVDKNDFIGKEPLALKKRIEEFTKEKYKTMTLLEINNFHKKMEAKIQFYKNKVLLKRIKAKVIKIMNKNDHSIYNYGIEINGQLLFPSEKLTENPDYEDTNEFLYIDGFPVYGIVPVTSIQEKIEVADDQFYANKELNDKSILFFIIGIILSSIALFMTVSGSLSPFISTPIVAIITGLFIFIFKGLKYNINSKYKLPNMFYFFKVSYFFVSIGDDGLNVQNVVPTILGNFSKLVSHDASLKIELNDRRLIRQKEELENKNKEEKKKENKSFFSKFLKGDKK